ncbi:hypothetical protein GQX74_007628 [Glossina fuscipes]|nr:hypothetical protein GQX74_007628 [Glossina fuscipes]
MDEQAGEGCEQSKPQVERTSFQLFKIENITVVRPPLLKVYYWEYLDVDKFNAKIAEGQQCIEHNFVIPTSQLNSKPLKIVCWLKNMSKEKLTLQLKRIKNCDCVLKQTRVGFNQFRYLYHCPHRYLVNITQEMIVMNADDLVAMSVIAYFYLFGTYVLTFEMKTSDSRTILMHFHINVVAFDPVDCILTHELIPVNIKDFQRVAQPIWICNKTMQSIQVLFKGRERGFRLINPNLVVPLLSVWPLIVEYRPSEFENHLELSLSFNNVRYKVPISCKGFLTQPEPEKEAPTYDYDCADFLYVIYPNKLEFSTEMNEEQFLMVAVHNYNQKCMDFKWQPYVISRYFSFSFEPSEFNLKAHHSRLCIVSVRTYDKPLHFKRIPAILEVHRILDKSTQIAKQLLTEVESIDNPKWRQDSFVEHVFLHIDIKVNLPKENPIIIMPEADQQKFTVPLLVPFTKSFHTLDQGSQTGHKKNAQCITIFEKLFWEYLSKSSYMRNTSKIPTNLSYSEVINGFTTMKKGSQTSTYDVDKLAIYNIVCYIIADALRDLSKNYRFVPREYLDPI